jgi:hypothetical protein
MTNDFLDGSGYIQPNRLTAGHSGSEKSFHKHHLSCNTGWRFAAVAGRTVKSSFGPTK